MVIEPIGGYFELELPRFARPHPEGLLLNRGRSCLEYVLRCNPSVRHIYLSIYTCDVMLEPLRKLGLTWSFIRLNESLEPLLPVHLADTDMIIVNNYFGLKDEFCRRAAERYGAKVVLDCSQAWYAEPPAGAHVFYTPRKFFGLPDGGVLCGPSARDHQLGRDRSWKRCSHLLKRIDEGAEQGFADFQRNDSSLKGQPMQAMSRLTERLLGAFNHETARQRRRENFATLHQALGKSNELDWSDDPGVGPMVYPYLTNQPGMRDRLRAQKIFVATYWPNVLHWCGAGEWEHQLARDLLPLPIDQRYAADDMARIIKLVA